MAEPSLQLRLAQKLALAPQLQQAIKLLQLTRIELREYIQQTVEANPLLEYQEPGSEIETEPGDAEAGEADPAADREGSEIDDEFPSSYEGEQDDWSLDAAISDPWTEAPSWDAMEREPQFADESTGSLRQHLLFQVNLGQFNTTDSAIATAVIYALDDDGFLQDTVEEIRASLAPDLLVDTDEVLAVLHRIQRMEPVGVATRDPAECIRVQLSALPSGTPGLDLARRIARDFIDLVADGELDLLGQETGAGGEAVHEAVQLIRSLEPRPGARYDNRRDEYLVPDVYVRRVDGRWVTHLSPDNDPRLRLNTYYVHLLRQSGGEDREYLRGRLQEARWLLSSLELRNQTLLKVSQCIVDQQGAFMEHGEIAMQPLVLRQVAEMVGVHESTVSRATNRKYMLTPRGLFELKHFFSSHVRTQNGGAISATAVKARIQVLIENEPHTQPLSDQEIAHLLGEAGVCAARRTIAKYRDSLGIGSSSQRRRAYRRMVSRGS